MTIPRIFGPRPVAPRRRYRGGDQAHPETLPALIQEQFRVFGAAYLRMMGRDR